MTNLTRLSSASVPRMVGPLLKRSPMTVRTLPLIALALLLAVGGARGQSIAANSSNSESEEDLLAREVDDPTAILTQLKLQDLYTPRNFQTTAQTNTVQVRPVIPVESFSLFPFNQIIRPTFLVQTLSTSRGSSTVTEFTDMQLFDLFLSNWPNLKETGFGWRIGPTFVFPTGREHVAGKHSRQAGPAARRRLPRHCMSANDLAASARTVSDPSSSRIGLTHRSTLVVIAPSQSIRSEERH